MCRLIAVFGMVLIFVHSCTSVKPPPAPPDYPKPYKIGKNWYQPIPHARGFSQKGKASWYGKKFHGRKTANGETYDMYAMTAAHKTLPLNTFVSVHNLNNDKKIKVRINDRGPFVRGRIIDLSYTAAERLQIVGPGTAPVKIIALGSATQSKAGREPVKTFIPTDYYKGNFTVQVGAFSDHNNAEKLKQKLDQLYKNAHITTYDNGEDIFYRVRVGSCSFLKQAIKYEEILIQKGFNDAFAVAE